MKTQRKLYSSEGRIREKKKQLKIKNIKISKAFQRFISFRFNTEFFEWKESSQRPAIATIWSGDLFELNSSGQLPFIHLAKVIFIDMKGYIYWQLWGTVTNTTNTSKAAASRKNGPQQNLWRSPTRLEGKPKSKNK